jgi:neutral ceramidase
VRLEHVVLRGYSSNSRKLKQGIVLLPIHVHFCTINRMIHLSKFPLCPVVLFATGYLYVGMASVVAAETNYKVGVAKVDITPTEPVVLAGYGSRTKPYEGVDTKLWARAMAIHGEKPHVIIAVDNCGVPKSMVDAVYTMVVKTHPIDRAAFVIAATHTHNAPALPGYARVLWQERLGEKEEEASQAYAAKLETKLVVLARKVLTDLVDATLHWGQGRATFGGNRRVLNDGKWGGFGFQEDGPVDHSVPTLIARNAANEVIGVWTNYACHCTTLGSVNRVHADWAGMASEKIEQDFPGAIALATIGCGADVGPQPSGNTTLSQQHGESVAQAVNRLAKLPNDEKTLSPLRRVQAAISSVETTIELPFASTFDNAHWEERAKLGGFEGIHGREMLRLIQQNGSLKPDVAYRISTWKFGDELAVLFLPGEVCVDYAVRLKRENDWRRLWINGWSNAMPGYIPSKRVLDEGGYEADSSMLYYAHPSRFADSVEDKIVTAVNGLLESAFSSKGKSLVEFFKHPGPAEATTRDFRKRVGTYNAKEQQIFDEIVELQTGAREGFDEVLHSDFEETVWFDYLGRKQSPRPFVRQLKKGDRVEWQAPALGSAGDHSVCFSGGLGWATQPETAGFELKLNDRLSVNFDLARGPRHWSNDDGSLELLYVATWTSPVDTSGFFVLNIKGVGEDEGSQPLKLAVGSLGEGSNRWFAVDRNKDAAKDLAKIIRGED